MMQKKVEILAPAGSWESLEAGICAGADAVYIGGSRFGARAYADNPEEESLLRAIDYVHLHGRKIYLTVNTLLKDREMQELYHYLLPYYRQGLDAVIVQDVGVMQYVRQHFPGLALHVSTQATVTHALGADFFGKLGAERIVPARELSLDEVREMKKRTGLEIECFVHGAMCYCYSGQCLLSSMIGGRSGNRGQCAQPCRLSYSIAGKKPQDILSLKDMCTVELIPDLVDAGIDSFKIEGRMKQPEYVYTVVSTYRKYTDMYLEKGRAGYRVTEEDRERLEGSYRRRGYCDGYYKKQNGREMLSLKRPNEKREDSSGYREYKIKEKINGNLILSEGKHATLCMEYKGNKKAVYVEVYGDTVQAAMKAPLDKERICKQMKKTGNTEFSFDELNVELEGNIFLPMQALNELRRVGINALEEKILSHYRRNEERSEVLVPEADTKSEKRDETESDVKLEVAVQSLEQLNEVVVDNAVSVIYVDGNIAFEKSILERVQKIRSTDRKVYVAMPYIFRQRAMICYEPVYETLLRKYDGVLIRNYESYEWLREKGYSGTVIADNNLYVFNQESKEFLRRIGISSYTLPAELNCQELRGISSGGILSVYGYQPVMITANCMKKTNGNCIGKDGLTWLTDRYRKQFAVKNYCKYCYNVIYNCAPLFLADMAKEIKTLGVSDIRLDFTIESGKEVQEIISLYKQAFAEGKKIELPDADYTRGHFKRGVK